jgi:thiol:disulfide interchange protein DsbA
MNRLFAAFTLAVLALASPAGAAKFEELTHYVPIANAPPPEPGSKIEVLEFFMWTCPPCMQFEPYLQQWLARKPADVEFSKVPAAFNPNAQLLARAFYALEALGEEKRLGDAFFTALIQDRRRMADEQAVVDFVRQLGVDEAKFREAMGSFAVAAKVRRAVQLADRYRVDGVPKLVVDGRWKNGDGLSSYQQMTEVADFLIEEARRLRQAPSTPAQ